MLLRVEVVALYSLLLLELPDALLRVIRNLMPLRKKLWPKGFGAERAEKFTR
jgi:hypothetical protein